jgi:hypothetical protein
LICVPFAGGHPNFEKISTSTETHKKTKTTNLLAPPGNPCPLDDRRERKAQGESTSGEESTAEGWTACQTEGGCQARYYREQWGKAGDEFLERKSIEELLAEQGVCLKLEG